MNQHPKPKPGAVPILVTIGLGIGIIIALVIAGQRELTSTESVLLGILLSAASMLASWLATHLYSQISLRDAIQNATETNTENIRSMGVRAAEKVLNLSSELQRLLDALSTALDDAADAEGTKKPTLILRERILSSIHSIETLKSMNDTFLSDWRGVIGDKIQQQHELENQIEFLTEELRTQIRERGELQGSFVSSDDLQDIQSRIEETENRLTQKIGALPFRVSTKKSKNKREDVRVECPSCTSRIQLRMRVKKGARKLVKCSTCNTHSKVLFQSDTEINISAVPMHEYEGGCPLCKFEFNGQIPDYAGAIVNHQCDNCGSGLIVSRSSTGVNIKTPKSGKQKLLPSKLTDAVRQKLPQRPWPTYIHKSIAKDLGVSNQMVSRIIGKLIDNGEYPLPDSEPESTTDGPGAT